MQKNRQASWRMTWEKRNLWCMSSPKSDIPVWSAEWSLIALQKEWYQGDRHQRRHGGEGDLTGLLHRIFCYVPGESEPLQAPRALRLWPNREDPSHNIIVRLVRWGDKQKIMDAAVKKKTLLGRSTFWHTTASDSCSEETTRRIQRFNPRPYKAEVKMWD